MGFSFLGSLTGVSKIIDGTMSSSSTKNEGTTDLSNKMEHRRIGGLEVSSIGLGCLPMVGYYGGKHDKFDREYANISLMGHRADPFTESQIDK